MIKLMSRSLTVSIGLLLLLAAAVPLYILAASSPPAEEKVVTDTGYVVFRIGAKEAIVKGPNVEKFAPELPKRPASVEGASVITMDAAPFIENDRTYVPVRYLANALGVADANVRWNAASRLVTLAEPGMPTVEMTVGVSRVLSNGKATATDVAPVVKPPGRTMLPAKWVAEALGYTVEWDGATKTVLAYKGARPSEEELKRVYEEFERIKDEDVVIYDMTPEQQKFYMKAKNPPPIEERAKNLGLTVEEYEIYMDAKKNGKPVPPEIQKKLDERYHRIITEEWMK